MSIRVHLISIHVQSAHIYPIYNHILGINVRKFLRVVFTTLETRVDPPYKSSFKRKTLFFNGPSSSGDFICNFICSFCLSQFICHLFYICLSVFFSVFFRKKFSHAFAYIPILRRQYQPEQPPVHLGAGIFKPNIVSLHSSLQLCFITF